MKNKIVDITFSVDFIQFERYKNNHFHTHEYTATPSRIMRLLAVTGVWVRWEKWAKASDDLFEEHYGYRP